MVTGAGWKRVELCGLRFDSLSSAGINMVSVVYAVGTPACDRGKESHGSEDTGAAGAGANSNWQPVNVATVARALVLLWNESARVVDPAATRRTLGGLVGAAAGATTSGSSSRTVSAAGAGSDYADRLRSAARGGKSRSAGETFSSVTTTRASTAAAARQRGA